MDRTHRAEPSPDLLDRVDEFPFDAERALRLLRRLSFPRAVGSTGERLIIRMVERIMKRSGRPATRERIPVATSARRFGSILAFLGAMALVLVGVLIVNQWPLVAVAATLMAALLVNAPWVVTRSLSDRFRSRVWSENLVSWPPEADGIGDEAAPPRVVFLAHHDSKSQRLPTGIRVGMVVVVMASCVILAVLSFVGMFMPGAIGVLPLCIFSSVAVICLFGLLVNVSGNLSPGTLDNGSGLVTMLELARSWRPRPDAPIDAVFLATGAEEVGLDGARAFLQRHEWWLRERPTLLINLESVGAGARVWLSGTSTAVALAEAVGDEQGIPTSRFRILGAGMDHEPFAAAGLVAVSLLGDVVGASAVLHTPRDGMHLISRDSLIRAARLASGLAWAWADQHRSIGPASWGGSNVA